MGQEEDLSFDYDDEKAIEYIKNYLPQELKEKFSDDELHYFLDLISEYYFESGDLEQEPDEDGFIDIDLGLVVDYIIKEAKKDEMGEFEPDDILFVVQGEMEYENFLDGEEE
ncbi:hypothetical protein [Bacteroides sp.]